MLTAKAGLEDYLECFSSTEPAFLTEIRRRTHLETVMPRMLAGQVQGRFLAMLSAMIRPARVLEIGTFTGYSTICLAGGLQTGGRIKTIEINEELVERNAERFRLAGFADRIEQICGNALDILPGLEPTYDLIYLDADKINYPQYFSLVRALLAPGAWWIVDNVLWNGKVFDLKPEDRDVDTAAIARFNEMVRMDHELEKVMIPLRDGLYLIRKRI